MAKVKINLPERFHYVTRLEVYISQVNYGGHLGHDAVLTLCHEARVRFLQSLGYSELDIEGVGTIMTDAAVQYISEGFAGDMLEIKLAVRDMTSSRFDIIYQVLNLTRNKELARVKTGIVCYDYALRKVKPIPAGFRNHFE